MDWKQFPLLFPYMFMKPVIQDSWDPVSGDDIVKFERDLGDVLPEDYRIFLLQHNGGYYPNYVCCVNDDGKVIDASLGLRGFDPLIPLGINNLGEYGLRFNAEWRGYNYPHEYLSIGSMACGDYLLLGLEDKCRGQIASYLHDMDNEPSIIATSLSKMLEMVQYDPTSQNWIETLPEFLAVEMGDIEGINRFLQINPDIEIRNDKGMTLLIRAANCQPLMIAHLLAKGASPHARDFKGRTPLIEAASWGALDCMRLIINAGADVNAVDDNGSNALNVACNRHSVRGAFLLIKNGADVNNINRYGQTPLKLCSDDVMITVLRPALLQAGAKE
jgi:hypothetical protein